MTQGTQEETLESESRGQILAGKEPPPLSPSTAHTPTLAPNFNLNWAERWKKSKILRLSPVGVHGARVSTHEVPHSAELTCVSGKCVCAFGGPHECVSVCLCLYLCQSPARAELYR